MRRANTLTAVLAIAACGIAGQKMAYCIRPDNRRVAMDARRVQALRDNVAALRLGEAKAAALSRVGRPNREDRIGPKMGAWTCYQLAYYVRLLGEEPGNTDDQIVSLIFDRREEKLVAVLSTVNGIEQRGNMAKCR